MLRDDGEVALNDLIALAEASAQAYRRAAEAPDAGAPADGYAGLATQREEMAHRLRTHERHLGDLPLAPDPELATARDLLAQVKAALSTNPHRTFLYECEKADQQLSERFTTALTLPLPEATVALLRRMHFDVLAALGRIAAIRARLRS